MRKYSAFAVAREALRGHRGWPAQWTSPEPRKEYDVIIVGAGGHGLGTAYYLAKEHGITNVAVIEKGWLGGGNTGRNTTIIRSNYLYDESAGSMIMRSSFGTACRRISTTTSCTRRAA
jgi:sarcosine oxidase subunit beta